MNLQNYMRELRFETFKLFYLKSLWYTFCVAVFILLIVWSTNQHGSVLLELLIVVAVLLIILIPWLKTTFTVELNFGEVARCRLMVKKEVAVSLKCISVDVTLFREKALAMSTVLTENSMDYQSIDVVRKTFSDFCLDVEQLLNTVLSNIKLLPDKKLKKELQEHVEIMQSHMWQFSSVSSAVDRMTLFVKKHQVKTCVRLTDGAVFINDLIIEYNKKVEIEEEIVQELVFQQV